MTKYNLIIFNNICLAMSCIGAYQYLEGENFVKDLIDSYNKMQSFDFTMTTLLLLEYLPANID